MNVLQVLLRRGYWAEAGADGTPAGGAVDRGDEVTPGEDEGKDEGKDEDNKAGEKAPADKPVDPPAADKDKQGRFIPKARFDEVLGKSKERADNDARTINELKSKLEKLDKPVDAKALDVAIEKLDDELDKAIADGDKAAVKALRAEIRTKTADAARAEAAQLAASSTALAYEKVGYDKVTADLEAKHPEIDPDHESYDQEVVDALIDLKEAYEAKGLGSTVALKKAAVLILSAKTEPKKDDAADKADEVIKKAEEAAAKRKEDAVKKGSDASNKQPASLKDSGKNSDKAGGGLDGNVAKMTDAEFAALPAATKRRLRGD